MTDDAEPQTSPAVTAMVHMARDFLSHNHSLFQSLNLQPKRLERGAAVFRVDLPEMFGNDVGGVHGGLFTIIIDSIMGLTVYTALDELKPIATINLRVDYLGETACGATAECACECVSIVDDIAYVTGRIIAEADGALLATATGAFIVGARGPLQGSRL